MLRKRSHLPVKQACLGWQRTSTRAFLTARTPTSTAISSRRRVPLKGSRDVRHANRAVGIQFSSCGGCTSTNIEGSSSVPTLGGYLGRNQADGRFRKGCCRRFGFDIRRTYPFNDDLLEL